MIVEHVAHHGGELAGSSPSWLAARPTRPRRPRRIPTPNGCCCSTRSSTCSSAVAEPQPVVVLLDDAHWADAGSVHLLRHVVSHLDPDTHILVLVTYRDTDIDRSHPALRRARRSVPRRRRRAHPAARPRRSRACARSSRPRAGIRSRRPASSSRIASRPRPTAIRSSSPRCCATSSRPARSCRSTACGSAPSRRARPASPRACATSSGNGSPGCPDETNDLLRTAAVFGREFDADLVAAVMQVDEDVAVDRLDEAVAAQLVDEVEGSPGRLSFAHALVRQTLLEELSTNKRVRLHRKIAELLDARPGTPIEVLAHHYLEAAVSGVAPPRDRVRVRSRARRERPHGVGRRASPVRTRARSGRHPRRRRPGTPRGDPFADRRGLSTSAGKPRPAHERGARRGRARTAGRGRGASGRSRHRLPRRAGHVGEPERLGRRRDHARRTGRAGDASDPTCALARSPRWRTD